MTAQTLLQPCKAYRIGDPIGAYPIFDATGSKLFPGRWNTPSSPMIYTAQDFATAMFEKIVHGSGTLPPNQHFVEIILSAGLTYEVLNHAGLPGWDHPSCAASKRYGKDWFKSCRSLLLFVPSVVVREANNILINPKHAQFKMISHSMHRPVHWDNRLFSSSTTKKVIF